MRDLTIPLNKSASKIPFNFLVIASQNYGIIAKSKKGIKRTKNAEIANIIVLKL